MLDHFLANGVDVVRTAFIFWFCWVTLSGFGLYATSPQLDNGRIDRNALMTATAELFQEGHFGAGVVVRLWNWPRPFGWLVLATVWPLWEPSLIRRSWRVQVR